MNLYDLFEGVSAAGYENIKNILTAVQNKTPATIRLTNGEDVEVDYTEARWLAGKFRAFQKVGRQEEFMMDVEDPVRLDGHMRQLRSLIDKQKNFQGSVVGQRDIPGETDKPYEKTLGEQYEGSPKAIGIAHVGLLDKKKNTDETVTLSFGPNGPAWEVPGKANKQWFLNVWQSYKRVGREEQFLELMGTADGFRKLLMRMAREQAKVVRDRMLGKHLNKPTSEQVDQKKSSENAESLNELDGNKTDDDVVNARTQRMLRQLRIQNPQAQSDLEALAYSFIDGQRKDREDIEKLEKETDNIEQNVKSDLQKRIATMNTQRGRIVDRLNQVQNTNQEQDDLLNQLLQIDRQQQRALDSLKKTTQTKGDQAEPTTATPTSAIDIPVQTGPADKGTSVKQKSQKKSAPARLSVIDRDDDIDIDRLQKSLPIGKSVRKKPTLTVVPKEPVPVNIGGPEQQPTSADQEPASASGQEPAQGDLDFTTSTAVPVKQVAEDNKVDLKKQLDRYTALALQANRAGDDEKCKMYQRRMNIIKDKMSKQITDEGRAGYNPLRDKEDYLDKRDHLFKMMNLPNMSQQDKAVIKQRLLDLDHEARKLKFIDESLRSGEYYVATVTLDNGEKRRFKVTYDEGYTDTIKNFYAKQGRKVVDIDMDFTVHGNDFREDLYSQGISEAQKKFPRASAEMIYEWASKWAQAHDSQPLDENKESYILYVNNKPAAKYQREIDAQRDVEHLKKIRPDTVIDLKREVCDLETIKHISEGQSIFENEQTRKLEVVRQANLIKKEIGYPNYKAFDAHDVRYISEKTGISVPDVCKLLNIQIPAGIDDAMREEKDACYHKVRSRYKVWPSAYASGALVQCRKKGAANWGNKSKK